MYQQLQPWEIDLVRQFLSAKVIDNRGRRTVNAQTSQRIDDFVTRQEMLDLFARNTYYINVLDPQYEVPVNTASDSTPFIQAIIDSIPAGTLFFPPGYYNISGLVSKSYVNFLGAGGYNSVRFIGSNAAPIIGYDTSAANVELVWINGISFEGSGAYAVYANDFDFYLSTFTVQDCFFDAELTEGLYGNLVLSDIRNNIFGLFGTAGTNSRHIYSKGSLVGNASNINRVYNNRFYHANGAEAIHFENGYMVYFRGNNFEQNDATITIAMKGMFGCIIRENWFEQNEGTYQISFENDTGDINGQYIVPIIDNWIDLSDATNDVFAYLDEATTELDIINNGLVMNDDQFLTYYNGIDNDNIGLRRCYGNKAIAHSAGTPYTPPVRNFGFGDFKATKADLLADEDLILNIRNAGNSDQILAQIGRNGDHSLALFYDDAELVKAAISPGSTRSVQAQDGAGNPTASLDTDGYVQADTGVKIAGTKVVGAQEAAIANPTGSGDVVSRVIDILGALRNHGLIDT